MFVALFTVVYASGVCSIISVISI